MSEFDSLFHEYDDGDWWANKPSYRAIVESFVPTILLEVSDHDYQGDSRFLVQDGPRYGWLQFGWGSCSGCDALQACDTRDELGRLWERLRDSVKWFKNKQEALKFFQEHDWEGDYSWHDDEQKEFVKEALKILTT